VFVDVTDAPSYIGAVRFERAAAMYTIISGEPVEIDYRACRAADPAWVGSAVNAARVTGIDLNVEEIVDADSTDAWRLLTWADQVRGDAQRDLLHQLWRAHFLEGADIGDRFVLVSRAALVGLEMETAEALLASTEYADEVKRQRETAAELGVVATPFVVVDAASTFAGLHSQDDYLQALHRIARGDPE